MMKCAAEKGKREKYLVKEEGGDGEGSQRRDAREEIGGRTSCGLGRQRQSHGYVAELPFES